MCILCLWELTQVDSAAEVVLAIFFFLSMSATLAWASLKVIRIAKRSVEMHKNPGYTLYSDPECLNKWGFLYVQFRATAYYFILPYLLYILVKGMFIAFGQKNGVVQAIALLLVEAGALIGISILRPWMDRRVNTFNISIGAINFVNVIFLLIFTSVFNQPVSTRSEPRLEEIKLIETGYCEWCLGCGLLHHERRVRLGSTYSCSHLLLLRPCLQKPRHSLSTNAR